MLNSKDSFHKIKNTPGALLEKKRNRLVLFAILFLTFLIYSNSISNGFTNWDDRTYITENSLIRDLSFSGIKAIFTSTYSGNYHPLTCLSNAIEYKFFGLNPSAYHFFNLLFHLLNVFLVFLFIRKIGGKTWLPAITALLFAIHPMHVESVSWVSERKDVLYSFFYFLSLIYFIRWSENKDSKNYYFISLLFFLLSLLSKSMAVTLPVVLLLLDFYRGNKVTRKNIIQKAPFFVLSATFGILAFISQQRAFEEVARINLQYYDSIFTASYGIIYYLIHLVAPVQLSALHPFPLKENGMLPVEYYLSFVLVILIFLAIMKWGKKRKEWVFGILFFLVTILPVIQIFPYGYAIVAERYTYIPYVGLFFIFANYFENKPQFFKWNYQIWYGVLILCIIFFSVSTFERNKVWKNSITLWSDAIEKIPASERDKILSGKANPNYGFIYYNRGSAKNIIKDYQGAVLDNDESIRFNSKYPRAFYNRAFAKSNLQDFEGALADYTSAIRLDTNYSKAYLNRANLKNLFFNDYSGAIEDFTRAINLGSDFTVQAYLNRGMAYLKIGNKQAACIDWNEASRSGNEDAIQMINQYCK